MSSSLYAQPPAEPDPSAGFQIILGNRQLAAVLFMALILMGMGMTVAYLVGRMMVPTQAVRAQTNQSASRSAGQLIVVDGPGKAACPDQFATKASGKSPVEPKAVYREPAPGDRYLQVIAIDRRRAEHWAAFLAGLGLSAGVSAGPDEKTWRVMVGPIEDDAKMTEIRALLEQNGFHYFNRVY